MSSIRSTTADAFELTPDNISELRDLIAEGERGRKFVDGKATKFEPQGQDNALSPEPGDTYRPRS